MRRALLHNSTSLGVINPLAWSTFTEALFAVKQMVQGVKNMFPFPPASILDFRENRAVHSPDACSWRTMLEAVGQLTEVTVSSPTCFATGQQCREADVSPHQTHSILCLVHSEIVTENSRHHLISPPWTSAWVLASFRQSLSASSGKNLPMDYILCFSKVLCLAVALLFTEN